MSCRLPARCRLGILSGVPWHALPPGLSCMSEPVLTWTSNQGLFASQMFLCSRGFRLFYFPDCCHMSANVDKNVMNMCRLDHVDAKILYPKTFRHGPFAARWAGGHWQAQIEEGCEARTGRLNQHSPRCVPLPSLERLAKGNLPCTATPGQNSTKTQKIRSCSLPPSASSEKAHRWGPNRNAMRLAQLCCRPSPAQPGAR